MKEAVPGALYVAVAMYIYQNLPFWSATAVNMMVLAWSLAAWAHLDVVLDPWPQAEYKMERKTEAFMKGFAAKIQANQSSNYSKSSSSRPGDLTELMHYPAAAK